MEFKRKLKSRRYIAIIYIALGVIMIAGSFLGSTENEFISSFGFALVVMGLARIRNYFRITKSDETIRKQQIIETDERNLSIILKARSSAFSAYLLLSGTAVIVLSLFSLHNAAKWISYSVLLLVLIYWIFYQIYQRKV